MWVIMYMFVSFIWLFSKLTWFYANTVSAQERTVWTCIKTNSNLWLYNTLNKSLFSIIIMIFVYHPVHTQLILLIWPQLINKQFTNITGIHFRADWKCYWFIGSIAHAFKFGLHQVIDFGNTTTIHTFIIVTSLLGNKANAQLTVVVFMVNIEINDNTLTLRCSVYMLY